MKAFCVSDLLALPLFDKARLVCGKKGLKNPITGINILEAPDVAEWIQGGEILLTNLYSLNALKPLATFVEALAKRNLSALVIKVGVFIDAIPEEMVKTADACGLPLIEVGRNMLYRDIAFAVTEKLLDERIALLKHIQEVHDSFIKLSLQNADVQAIVHELSNWILKPVVVYNKNDLPLCASSSEFLNGKLIGSEKEKLPFFRAICQVERAGKHFDFEQIVFPVTMIGHLKIRLGVIYQETQVEEEHLIVIKNAIDALTIELIKEQAVDEAQKRFHSDVLNDLFTGQSHQISSVLQRAALLQWDLKKPHAVVSFALYDKNFRKAREDAEALEGLAGEKAAYDALYELLNQAFPKHPIQVRTDKLIMLWPIEAPHKKNWIIPIRTAMQGICRRWETEAHSAMLHIGIGNIALEPAFFSRSFDEAEDTLRIMKNMSAEHRVSAYQDLGVYRMLLQFEDRQKLEDFIPRAFEEILQSGSTGRQLLKTLHVYLQSDRNMNKTADVLCVHNKTVAYRIERIKELTGLHLSDPDEILHLSLGFKIFNLLSLDKTPEEKTDERA